MKSSWSQAALLVLPFFPHLGTRPNPSHSFLMQKSHLLPLPFFALFRLSVFRTTGHIVGVAWQCRHTCRNYSCVGFLQACCIVISKNSDFASSSSEMIQNAFLVNSPVETRTSATSYPELTTLAYFPLRPLPDFLVLRPLVLFPCSYYDSASVVRLSNVSSCCCRCLCFLLIDEGYGWGDVLAVERIL